MTDWKLYAVVAKGGMDWTGTCVHKHQLGGTGAVFFQSLGFLKCAECGGYQAIKKPLN